MTFKLDMMKVKLF